MGRPGGLAYFQTVVSRELKELFQSFSESSNPFSAKRLGRQVFVSRSLHPGKSPKTGWSGFLLIEQLPFWVQEFWPHGPEFLWFTAFN